jgi:hypothetical protein
MYLSTLTPELEAVIKTVAQLEDQRFQQERHEERLEEQRQVMAQNHYLEQTYQIGVGA